MINIDMIKKHGEKYKSFNSERLIKWLNEQNNWHWFKSVAKANQLMRRHRSFANYVDKHW